MHSCHVRPPLCKPVESPPALCLPVSQSQAAAPQETPPWLINAPFFSSFLSLFHTTDPSRQRGNPPPVLPPPPRRARPSSFLAGSHGCSRWR